MYLFISVFISWNLQNDFISNYLGWVYSTLLAKTCVSWYGVHTGSQTTGQGRDLWVNHPSDLVYKNTDTSTQENTWENSVISSKIYYIFRKMYTLFPILVIIGNSAHVDEIESIFCENYGFFSKFS